MFTLNFRERMFHKIHFVEKWGRGIGFILSKEPETDFREIGRQFIVTFKRKSVSEAVGVSGGVSGGVNEGVSEGVSEGVNLLIELIQKNPGNRVPQLAKTLGIPAKTIERWIKQLKEDGKIEFRGSPKNGGYWAK